jgi:ubiquinone biosynthesis UbiH/UbiF/VisC/COQ6 family hydroxylase
VSNHLIKKALFDEVSPLANTDLLTEKSVSGISTSASRATVTLTDGEHITCSLVVAADSRYSDTRQMVGIPASMHDFGRVCIVARMQHEQPHGGVAFECFHYGRTLAVLPLSECVSSIVVTAPAEQRDSLMNMSSAAFSQDIQHRFGERYGPMRLCTERFAYPLLAVHARRFFARRFALVGDAAVGMHPVTAHGFNLGLSGQDILAREICSAAASHGDIGAASLLERYSRKHMRVTRPIYSGTNAIVKAFTDDRLPAKIARKLILRVANNLPPIKQLIRKKLTEERHQGRLWL